MITWLYIIVFAPQESKLTRALLRYIMTTNLILVDWLNTFLLHGESWKSRCLRHSQTLAITIICQCLCPGCLRYPQTLPISVICQCFMYDLIHNLVDSLHTHTHTHLLIGIRSKIFSLFHTWVPFSYLTNESLCYTIYSTRPFDLFS